ncbi:MAG TPA: hypothetical protein VMB47_06555 [Candidatus Aquilonibacter sp.]|nr:hypothetical protein [Candidatus Aquilonibacter sp.]
MKKWILTGSVLAAMVLTLTFSKAVPASFAAPAPQPAAAAAAPAPPHPEIRAALNSLERAKTHLQEANHDFGGHRVDAIKAIDAAMNQLQICMRYDN